jgi:hypothetical protein
MRFAKQMLGTMGLFPSYPCISRPAGISLGCLARTLYQNLPKDGMPLGFGRPND